MQTTRSVKFQRKRKRDSVHHSLRWYHILALSTIGSKHSRHNGLRFASALSPNSRTNYAFIQDRRSSVVNLRGGDEAEKDDEDVLSMDDSELDAYIDFLLTKSTDNPFQTKVVAAETQEPPTDDTLAEVDLPEIDQQEEQTFQTKDDAAETQEPPTDDTLVEVDLPEIDQQEEQTFQTEDDAAGTQEPPTDDSLSEVDLSEIDQQEEQIFQTEDDAAGTHEPPTDDSFAEVDVPEIDQQEEQTFQTEDDATETQKPPTDDSLAEVDEPDIDQQEEQTFPTEDVAAETKDPPIDDSLTEFDLSEIERQEEQSEPVHDEMDSSITQSMETEATVEESNSAVALDEMVDEVEISEPPSIAESIEKNVEAISSKVVEDEVIPQSTEEISIPVPDASAGEEQSIEESSETGVPEPQETVVTSRRSSIWGKLYKPLVTFEQDDASSEKSEENVEELAKEEAPAQVSVDDATEDVQESEVVAVSTNVDQKTKPRPPLTELCNDQWQKLKSMMGIESSAAKEVEEFSGREPQRDYSKIYQKYYAEEDSSSTETDSGSTEADKSSKPGSSWFGFFSKKSTKDTSDDSSLSTVDESEPIVDMETGETSCIVEETTTTIRRQVLSLDRIYEVSPESGDGASSDEKTEQLDEDQARSLSSEITTQDGPSGSEEKDLSRLMESSEQNQDAVVLSLEIPDAQIIEEVDERPILEAEEETDAQESTVLSLDIPEDMKEDNDEPPITEDLVDHDSRVVLSLDIPSVEKPEEASDEELGETSQATDVQSVDIPVVNTSEDVEADLIEESEDDVTSSVVGRFVLSMDRPADIVELHGEGAGQSLGEALKIDDDSVVSNEITSSEFDDTAEIDFGALEEDTDLGAFDDDLIDESTEGGEGNRIDIHQVDVGSSDDVLDFSDLDEELPNETIEDEKEQIDETIEEKGSIVTSKDKGAKSKKKGLKSTQKPGIVDQGLLIILMVTVMLEELLKVYIVPVVGELLDWAFKGKPPPLFSEDFSLRKFLGLRGGAATASPVSSTKAKLEDEQTGDGLKGEESEEGSDSDAENRSTKTDEDEATTASAHQSLSASRVRPNFIYRYLLGCGRPGHSIIMVSVFSIKWIEIYLPAVAFFAANLKRQVFGERRGFQDAQESFAAQTTGFVDGTGSTVRGAKKKKAQTQKDDQQALDQLNRLGDANQARYYFVSNAFLKRHAIGPYSTATSEIVVAADKSDVDEEESEDDWVVEALTRKEVSKSASEPSVGVSISSSGSALSVGVDFGFGEKRSKSTKRASISEVAISSASSRPTKSRKPKVQRVSDRESGVVGRIRAVGANSLVGRSILGAYPGDVPSPDEAADANGLLGLASKYGYGDWSDVDWSDQDDMEFGSRKRRTRKKRRSVPGSVRKEKETLGGLDLGEIVRETQSSRTRRTRSASSQPRTNDKPASSATKPVRKTKIRRKKKLQPTSSLKKTNAQQDVVKATIGSKILKTENAATGGSTVTGPAIESMKETVKSEKSTKTQADATQSSESSKATGKAQSSTLTQPSSALKKSNAQKRIVKSTRESKVLNPGSSGSAVAGSAVESLKKAAKSKADDSSSPSTNHSTKPGTSSPSSSVVGPAIGSIKESAAKAKSGVANSAVEELKKKAKEKSKSSVLDPPKEE